VVRTHVCSSLLIVVTSFQRYDNCDLAYQPVGQDSFNALGLEYLPNPWETRRLRLYWWSWTVRQSSRQEQERILRSYVAWADMNSRRWTDDYNHIADKGEQHDCTNLCRQESLICSIRHAVPSLIVAPGSCGVVWGSRTSFHSDGNSFSSK